MGHEAELRAFGRGFAWLVIVPVLLHTAWLARKRRLLDPLTPAGSTRAVLLVLVYTALATLYVFLGDPRMRVPFDPLLVVLAVDAWRSVGRAVVARLPLRAARA
jgi:hypothetical protein